MNKSIIVGCKVSILKEKGSYIVRELKNHKALVEDEHGMTYEFPLSDLIVQQSFDTKIIGLTKDKEEKKSNKKSRTSEQLLEIDLHFEKLSNSDTGFTAHDKLLLQINAFKHFFNKMLEKRQTKFLIIHGAGQGKLKAELKILIQGKTGATMHDYNYHNGAVGCSLIEIQLSKIERF
jgi:hypothetical protein